jgi:trehalose 6-phosphate synthase
MTDEDVAVSEEARRPVELSIDGIDYSVLLVGSDPDAYDGFYNVIANPILWFIQHYLWDLSNAPDVRQEELDAWDYGYQARQPRHRSWRPRPDQGPRAAAGDAPRLPPLHAPRDDPGRATRPSSCTTSSTSPGHSPTAGASCRGGSARRSSAGMLANDIIGFHTHAYCSNFLRCCDELLEVEVDYERGVVSTRARRLGRAPTRSRSTPSGCDAPPNRRGRGGRA